MVEELLLNHLESLVVSADVHLVEVAVLTGAENVCLGCCMERAIFVVAYVAVWCFVRAFRRGVEFGSVFGV